MITKGARVKLSEAGRRVVRAHAKRRLGTVTGMSRGGAACRVLWNGRVSTQLWWVEYLEPVSDDALTPAPPPA